VRQRSGPLIGWIGRIAELWTRRDSSRDPILNDEEASAVLNQIAASIRFLRSVERRATEMTAAPTPGPPGDDIPC
jgi:hypothetical protein